MPAKYLETLWPRIESLFSKKEEIRLGDWLEEALALGLPTEEAGKLQRQLIALLEKEGLQEISRGIWLAPGSIPSAPARLRAPTIRQGPNGISLVEAALQDWEEVCKEEGVGEFTKRLSYREIIHGCLRLSEAAARLFPDNSPTRLPLNWEDGEGTAWFRRDPFPMIYGLEAWLGDKEPGAYLRIVRVERERFAIKMLEQFDEVFNRSERRLFDLNALYNLRRFGMTYQQHLRVLLADRNPGLRVKDILDALEERLGFRPHPPTIRALLSSGEEFRCTGGLWEFIPQEARNSTLDELNAWYERNGAQLRAYQPYKALLMTVGTSLEPLKFTLRYLRPEGACFLVTRDSEKSVSALLASAPVPPAWIEIVLIEDFEDLSSCQKAASEGFQSILDHGIRPRHVLVDFTGGTKAMSVGVVLATRSADCAYAYVGGSNRDMGQRGTVIDGSEVLRITP